MAMADKQLEINGFAPPPVARTTCCFVEQQRNSLYLELRGVPLSCGSMAPPRSVGVPQQYQILDAHLEWPRRRAGVDCGAFGVAFALAAANNVDLTKHPFSQRDMINFRKHIALGIYRDSSTLE